MSDTYDTPDQGNAGDIEPAIDEGQPPQEPDTEPAPTEPEDDQ
jgi:hypothetical protein